MKSRSRKEIIEDQKQFNKMVKKIHKEANIKDCFHPNKNECTLPIKRAHSLQRQGALNILERDTKGNGNKYLYLHTERCYNIQHDFLDLNKVGRVAATTFDGFCSFHDTNIFKSIENEPENMDINNPEHLFLHSYRSFAISHHRKHEELKLYNSNDEEVCSYISKYFNEHQKEAHKLGVSKALEDYIQPKKDIDQLLLNQDYDGLEYYIYELPYTVPVGCAAYITPHFMPNGDFIQMNPFSQIQSSIITTVLPFSSRSVVILAAFPDDKLGCSFLDAIDKIKYERSLQKFLSYFIFSGAENIVVSPGFIDNKNVKWRKSYCHMINMAIEGVIKYPDKKFTINYFDNVSSLKQ